MTLDFQDNILKFLVSTSEGRNYIKLLDMTCFDLPEKQLVFDLLSKYFDKYQTIPKGVEGRANLIEFFYLQTRKQQIAEDAKKQIEQSIRDIYVDNWTSDTVIIREEIVKFSQRQQTKMMFRENSDKVKDGDEEFFERLHREMGKIVQIGNLDVENARGGFIIRDFTKLRQATVHGHPTYLKRLNRTTSSGGFKSPELVIFMGAPKSFKTGVAINIAVEYCRDGLNGYYVDCENGIRTIKSRIYQQMLAVERRDMFTGEYDDIMQQMVNKWKVLGGDMAVDYYPANTKTCADVDANLTYLRDEHGFMPDFIVWDYPDLLRCVDPSIKDKRLQIQAVYHDIVRLHNKWSAFGIGLSQVSKAAVEREIITIKDFAEDFGKAANAHAAFAICRTPEEKEAGLARIIPVMQREGEEYHGERQTCYVEIDPANMQVREILEPADVINAQAGMASVRKERVRRSSDVEDN